MYIHKYMRTYTHTCMHTSTPFTGPDGRIQVHKHTCMHTYSYTCDWSRWLLSVHT